MYINLFTPQLRKADGDAHLAIGLWLSPVAKAKMKLACVMRSGNGNGDIQVRCFSIGLKALTKRPLAAGGAKQNNLCSEGNPATGQPPITSE